MRTTLSQRPSVRSTPRVPRRWRRLAGVALTIVATGCDQTSRVGTTDSLLNRDLTLATESRAPVYTLGLSDTAIAEPTAKPVAPELNGAATPTQSKPPSREIAATVPPKAVPTSTPNRNSPTTLPIPRSTPVASEPVPVAGAGSDSVTSAGTAGSNPKTGSSTARRALGSGTRLISHTSAEICSLANRPGDRLVATLDADVMSPDGGRLIAGTPVLIEMSAPATDGSFAFRVKSVQVNGVLVPVEGTVTVTGETTERQISKGGDKGKVIGGAIAGAILGRVLGGGTKGTIIGAAGGAAAGTAAAARNTETEKCLPAGATVTVTLTAPLVLVEGVP